MASADLSHPCLNDIGAERAVLAGILANGADGFLDIEEILCANDFYGVHHAKLFTTLKFLVTDRSATEFDIPTVISAAKMLGFEDLVGKGKDEEYLQSLFSEAVTLGNARSLAAVVFKLSVGRQASCCAQQIQNDLRAVTGNEEIASLLALIEDPVFAFTAKLMAKDNALVPMAADFHGIVEALAANPKDIIGLPTGFQRFDYAIGGGLRPGGVTVIGARPKVGKSFFCLNVGYNAALTGLPVLYLDTELPRKWQMMRLTSLMSGVDLDRIETGTFASSEIERDLVFGVEQKMTALPFTHCSIAGQSIKGVLSIIRRWLAKNVGFSSSGKAKPCMVLYDYLKLMDPGDIKSNLAEHQLLGFLLTEMNTFALKYDVPILATVQLNRDGGDREEGSVISGSDRILWLANSVTILKKKSAEELNEDPPSNGDRKLVVTDTRFGAGMETGDYVNIKSHLEKATLTEGPKFSEVATKFPANTAKKKKKKHTDEAVQPE